MLWRAAATPSAWRTEAEAWTIGPVSLAKIEAAMPRRPEIRSFVHANAAYERWLATHLRILRADLQRKHAAMAEAAFPFMRATYFRWAERWPVVCSGLTDA